MDQLHAEIEKQVDELDPRIELIALQRPGRETLRLFIDHPDGVGLELCERVTRALGDLLADYALEVSSPGLDRPLVTGDHFARFAGEHAQVRLAEPIGGRRNLTGRILAADADSVTLQTEDDEVAVPLARVHRANLVPETSEVLQ